MKYQPDERFDYFLERLHQRSQPEWHWLLGKFRHRLMPFLKKQTARYPAASLLSKDQFIEEVFEETLLKFYELFGKGEFTKYADLEATVVTVAKFKLQEGFGKLKKERRWYFMEPYALDALREKQLGEEQAWQNEQLQKIAEAKRHLKNMEPDERALLTRFFSGEELRDIADDLGISPAACRKRKQRILEKLRASFFGTLKSLFF